uniref:Glycosyltransferase family 92 protein n=1 Tax=Hirondellea gigas TaxID=1518452 RepID=A0A6A7FYZ1_9CRUS
MRHKPARESMSVRSEALRYWRSIHAKYSLLNDFNRQRRSAAAKKMRQRSKERNRLSIFSVVFFVAVFLIILLTEVFFIDDRHNSILISEKRPDEFDAIADIPDYVIDDRKLVEIDSYRRQELSVKNIHDNSLIRKDVYNSRLKARVSGKLIKAMRATEKFNWKFLKSPEISYFSANSSSSDAHWMPVINHRHKFFVYSAFYDNRKGRIIRIIGATLTKKSERVWCKYWYSNSSTLILGGAVKIIRENWNLKYSACFVACPLSIYRNGKQPIPPPESVSVLTSPGGNATNKLTVINNLDVDVNKTKNSFAVCVKPLHFDYNYINQIIEFIELNRIIGVEHFTLYNHTIGPEVGCILESYVKEGIVTILPWKLNLESQKEIRTEGLFSALNDCMYRYMYRYKYILMIDLDEYIVPHSNLTLPELITFLNARADVRKIGAISFQNSFFYLQWPDDPSSAGLPALVTQRKTRRRQRFHPHKQRSKYIAVSPFVVEAGNHFVWEFLPQHGTLNVPSEVAFLHHYRICEFGGDDCVRNPRTTDTSMVRYRDQLVTAFTSKVESLSQSCHLPPLNTAAAAAVSPQLWPISGV